MKKSDKKEQNKEYINFKSQPIWLKYILIVLLVIVAFAIFLIIVYNVFEYGNPTLVTRSDWLAFLGAYVAAFASVILSMIALFQTKEFNKQENRRRAEERHLTIQPIFSVEAKAYNIEHSQSTHYLNEFKRPDDPPPIIKFESKVSFSIKNIGQFPITNVIVFDNYIKSSLESGEVMKFSVTYDDALAGIGMLYISESSFERKNGYPGWFNINYEDTDGTNMYKTFEYDVFEGVSYYTLINTEIV